MTQYSETTPEESISSKLPARYLSRDLSSLKFNERVLDQVGEPEKTIYEWLMFLHIGAANLDEFFMVRVGKLYDYINYDRIWLNKLGLHLLPFRDKLLQKAQASFQKQHDYFLKKVQPACAKNHFSFVRDITLLKPLEQDQLKHYFKSVVFPMLTPIVFDTPPALLALRNKDLVFGVVTHSAATKEYSKRITFIQLPEGLLRFYRLSRRPHIFFVPIEEVIRAYLPMLFSNLVILSVTLFRITRNGYLSLEDSEEKEVPFIEAFKRMLKKRNQGRVVRLEITENYDPWLLDHLKRSWDIDQNNVFQVPTQSLMDLTGLHELIQHGNLRPPLPSLPASCPIQRGEDLFEVLKQQDILLHHPYNSIDLMLDFLNRAAEDPYVSAIKMTIYRLAQNSAITVALLKAAAAGKHVSVVIEIKARFDEAYNMQEAKKLEQGGCFVGYGMHTVKTHAKLMLIVREEKGHVTRYVHLSTGNYNEETAQSYADISLLTTDEAYAHDVSAFFHAITGHAMPQTYKNLITAPFRIRNKLIGMIRQETQNAQQGLSCGIVIKVNALEDEATIEALYKASQAGVPIRLIVRGICCLIPQRYGLSDNITVRSIVGNFLEHARIFYFHNQGDAKVYAGSVDIMVRSLDQRIESLFLIKSPVPKQEAISILAYNLRDNVNSYMMQEDGTYTKIKPGSEAPFNIHKSFFSLTIDEVMRVRLFR